MMVREDIATLTSTRKDRFSQNADGVNASGPISLKSSQSLDGLVYHQNGGIGFIHSVATQFQGGLDCRFVRH